MTSGLDSLSTLLAQLSRLEHQLADSAGSLDDDIIKTAEAAKLLRISENALRALARAGEVPHWQIGNGLRFSRRQLLDVFRERARGVQPAALLARR